MQPLRVLHVTPYYERAWGYGGIPRVAAGVCRGLAARGHDVSVVTTDARDEGSRLEAGSAPGAAGVTVHVFKNASNRLAYHRQLFVPLGLASWLREHAGDFDVAHVHGHHHLLGVLASRALRRAGVPYLVAPNGLAPRVEGQRLAKWAFDVTVGRGVLPHAARVVAVSEAECAQLISLGVPAERLRVVPNPVDPGDFEPQPAPGGLRRAMGPSFDAEKLVLYLGTLIPRKHVDVLVRALEHLQTPSVGLAIAGNDLGAGGRIRAVVASLGLGSRVRFLGQVEGRERAELLGGADVVAYPGRAEAFGLVPLEALLCGTPVVVADDSGCGEVVRRVGGGLLVPPGEPAPLARALDEVLATPAHWRGAAATAGDEVRRLCSLDAVAAAFEAVYRELLT